MIEPAGDKELGSIGAFYVAELARSLGHTVDFIAPNTPRYHYDVELVSIHHPNDYPRFQVTPKHGKIRIVGGHVTYNNPRPLIPLTDVLCLGDGEEWIERALLILDNEPLDALRQLPGTIVSKYWHIGDTLPSRNYCEPLPDNPAYLNRPNTLSATWYIEIARGCPYRCDYCELGNAMPYRYRPTVDILQLLDNLDTLQSRKVNFFAPDHASHPGYVEIMEYAKTLGLRESFGSYRLDRILRMAKKGVLPFAPNQLIRVGIDGLTESTRNRVHKRITNRQIVDYFRMMVDRGHINFKIFQMFGYPWETLEDFNEWERIMGIVLSIPVRKSISLRVKWTPLIPQPESPLGDATAKYDLAMVKRIRSWHQRVREPKSRPGWHVESDGLMSKRSHAKQIHLTRGDETLLLENATYINPKWRQ